MAKQHANARTLRIEKLAADLAAVPLMREAVLHSARFADGKVEKEVCDILLVHLSDAIVVSVKSQAHERESDASARWLKKNAPKAIQQVRGAYRTIAEHNIWCTRDQSARIDLKPRELRPRYGLALLETRYESTIDLEQTSLFQMGQSPRIGLMAIHDFLNLVHYLRTWADLLKYLTERAVVLRGCDARTIGAERALLGYYTVMRDTFDGCLGLADAKIVTARGQHVREGSAFRDSEVALAGIFEEFLRADYVTNAFELPPDVGDFKLSDLDPKFVRDELRGLNIQERAALGEQIGHVCGQLCSDGRANEPAYASVRLPGHPNKIFVVVAALEAEQVELNLDALDTTIAACVFHERSIGITILLNQVGEDIRFTIGWVADVEPSVEMLDRGQELFGHVLPRRTTRMR